MATGGAPEQPTLQRTRDTLGKIIKKPPLTDKLLSRPPFRFIHDIITEVTKASGFYKGLYAGTELDGKSFQDKESKMAYLQKAIDVLSFVQGEVVRVKASKIVAGQEVDRTNEFLQQLAIAILKKLDSTEAVQKVLKGEKPANKKKGTGKGKMEEAERPAEAKGRSRSGQSKESAEREGKKPRERGRERRRDKEERPQKAGSEEQRAVAERVEERKDGSLSKERGPETERNGKNEEQSISGQLDQRPGAEVRGQTKREAESGEDEGLGSETRLDRPRSARGGRRRGETGEREEARDHDGQSGEKAPEMAHTSQRSPSPPPTHPHTSTMGLVAGRRPGSARPAPPRIVRQPSSDDIASSTPLDSGVAPPTVIMDTPGNRDEEDEAEDEDKEYEVGDPAHLAPPTNEGPNILKQVDSTSDQPEGVLTKTIVATKERLEKVEGDERETETDTTTPAQRKREMEAVKKEAPLVTVVQLLNELVQN